jgi:hypothetical protein
MARKNHRVALNEHVENQLELLAYYRQLSSQLHTDQNSCW